MAMSTRGTLTYNARIQNVATGHLNTDNINSMQPTDRHLTTDLSEWDIFGLTHNPRLLVVFIRHTRPQAHTEVIVSLLRLKLKIITKLRILHTCTHVYTHIHTRIHTRIQITNKTSLYCQFLFKFEFYILPTCEAATS
jgi:hypothetical protein